MPQVNPYSPAMILLLVVVFVLIIVFIVVGRNLYVNTDGFGVWGRTVPLQCRKPDGTCGEGGTRDLVTECIPNEFTGRGCIGDDGFQTFEPKIRTESCKVQCHRSVWSEKDGVLTCVAKDATGNNNCHLTSGNPPRNRFYNIGDTVVLNPPNNQSPEVMGQWDQVPQFTSHYVLDEKCITPGNNILEEGYYISPLTCSSSKCPDIPDCISEPVDPSIVTNGTFNFTTSVACQGVYQDGYTYHQPCRYRPFTVSASGVIKRLLESIVFLTSGQHDVIAPIQTPSLDSSVSRFRDLGSDNHSRLFDVPIIYFSSTVYTHSDCLPTEIIFNTGVLVMISPVTIISNTSLIAKVGCMIPSKYRGWLSVGVDGKAYWTQATASYDSPGINYQQAQTFRIDVGNYNSTTQAGYPVGSVGKMQISIKKHSGGSISVPHLENLPSITMNSLTAQLFSLDTELCTRTLYGQDTCNLLHIRSVHQDSALCDPPLLN